MIMVQPNYYELTKDYPLPAAIYNPGHSVNLLTAVKMTKKTTFMRLKQIFLGNVPKFSSSLVSNQ